MGTPLTLKRKVIRMNNAEYIRLMKKQREREKMKEVEVVEQLKIEDTEPETEPDQAEDIQEVEADVITDRENGDNEPDKGLE